MTVSNSMPQSHIRPSALWVAAVVLTALLGTAIFLLSALIPTGMWPIWTPFLLGSLSLGMLSVPRVFPAMFGENRISQDDAISVGWMLVAGSFVSTFLALYLSVTFGQHWVVIACYGSAIMFNWVGIVCALARCTMAAEVVLVWMTRGFLVAALVFYPTDLVLSFLGVW